MPVSGRTAYGSQVETSPDLSTWTLQSAMDCLVAEAGAGQVVGSATIRVITGSGSRPGGIGAPATLSAITSLQGYYVRVSRWDTVGAAWVPIWWGTLDGYDLNDDGSGGGGQIIHATGLAAGLLGSVTLSKGWVTRADSSVVEAPYAPPFNRAPTGDRSAVEILTGGVTSYVHQLFGSTNRWRASDILDSLLPRLAGVSLIHDGCLDYEVAEKDYAGWSLLDIVNDLANARRGCTWDLTVIGSTPTLTAYSIAASAIGSLPASTYTGTPNLTGSSFISGVTIQRNDSRVYDEIRVTGAKPWIAMTVAYEDSPDEALTVGWTGASRTAANADQWWRRFEVYSAWDGHQLGSVSVGLRAPTVVSGAYTGARSFTGSVDDPRGAFEFTSETPMGEGWTTDAGGPRQRAQAWIYDGANYIDATSAQDASGLGLSLAVRPTWPPAIELGDGEDAANTIKANVDGVTGARVVATIGVRESTPLIVSWTNGSPVRSGRPRVLEINLPEAEQWVALAGTITATSGASTTTVGTTTVIRDDIAQLEEMLDLARAYYSTPEYGVSWTDVGISVDYQPGTLLTTVTTGYGVITANAVVTRVRWDFERNRTSWTSARVVPDLEAIR